MRSFPCTSHHPVTLATWPGFASILCPVLPARSLGCAAYLHIQANPARQSGSLFGEPSCSSIIVQPLSLPTAACRVARPDSSVRRQQLRNNMAGDASVDDVADAMRTTLSVGGVAGPPLADGEYVRVTLLLPFNLPWIRKNAALTFSPAIHDSTGRHCARHWPDRMHAERYPLDGGPARAAL